MAILKSAILDPFIKYDDHERGVGKNGPNLHVDMFNLKGGWDKKVEDVFYGRSLKVS